MGAATPSFATLPEVLEHHAAKRPQAPALHFEGRDFSYTELAAQSVRLAALLWHDWGVRAGDRVAWLGFNHAHQLALLFALARLGAILLPLNFRLAPGDWDTLMRDCAAAHLVHDEALADAALSLAKRNGIAAHGVQALEAVDALAAAPYAAQGSAAALIVYTSGTTGQPKGAVHTQANLLANMALAAQVQQMGQADVVLTVLPLFHVGGLCIQTLPALYAGARVVLLPRFTPEATFAAIAQHRPSLTLQVPATMKALIEHPAWPAADLGCLRAVWAGSSLLPAPLVQAFHDRGLPVANVYGATETGPFSIALPPEHAVALAGSCGWPAPGVEARIEGEGAGELWLRGANVVQRYWPDHPAVDQDGWFHTGDLGAQESDGSWRIVGRAKDLIISGGENIHPAEIEAALAEHPAVAECAAFGLPDAQWGEAVAVAVVFKPGAQAADDELRAWLLPRLARYKLPRHWFRVQALPKTALGKLQRQALAATVPSAAS